MTDKAIRSAKLTAAGILDKARARTAVTRAGGQIAPSKYLPNVPRQVHAGGGKVDFVKDNPSGDWLKSKQARAAQHPDMKFMTGSITGVIGGRSNMFLPTHILKGIAGLNDEVRTEGVHKYDSLLAGAQKGGFDPDQEGNKVVVGVNHYGQPYLLEGNTRVAVAHAMGVPKVKAEVRYWNGAEEVDGPMHPDKVSAMASNDHDITKAGGGKVAFMQGNHPLVPEVLYHGTARDIQSFDPNAKRSYDVDPSNPEETDTGWFGKGHYFTASPKLAAHYADEGARRQGGQGASIIPAHVAMKNPFVVDMKAYDSGAKTLDNALSRVGVPMHPRGYRMPSEQTAALVGMGHDGVIATREGKPEEYVAFHPTQIKSAIGNNGNFDPNDPDITKAGGGDVEGDNGHIYVVHGGSDFDQIDPSYSGRGEPGNIRPLGKGLYSYVLDHTDPENFNNAIKWATRYSQKYGGGKKALHVYKIPKSSSTVFNGYQEVNAEGYPKPIEGLGSAPKEELNAYEAHEATEPPYDEKNSADYWAHERKRRALWDAVKDAADLRMEHLPIGLTEVAIQKPKVATRIGKFSLDTPTSDILDAVKSDVQSRATGGRIHAEDGGKMELRSRAAEAIRNQPQLKGSVDQLLAVAAKGKGVKQAELANAGRPSGNIISKEELARHFEDAMPKVQVKKLKNKEPDPLSSSEMAEYRRLEADPFGYGQDGYDRLQELEDRQRGEIKARYQQYTLPQGENYREHLLHLPAEYGPNSWTNFRSSHWETPNVIAHLRMKDRDNGKTLHVEEVQSDWGQEGRERGFYDIAKPFHVFDTKTGQTVHEASTADEAEAVADKLGPQYDYQSQHDDMPPKGPYVGNTQQWTDLALKHALTEAAKGGHDRVVLSPGEANADLYGQRTPITNARLVWASPEAGYLYTRKKDAKYDSDAIQFQGEKHLSSLLGKQHAKALLAQDGLESSISEPDMHLGGHGMVDYYNNIVHPSALKLLQQHDPSIKPESYDLPNGYKGLSLPMTDTARQSILKNGFGAFKRGGTVGKEEGGALGEDDGITAYHSSPHDFDQFDISKLGTGEGNQSYGPGLYFAENPKVSDRGGQYWNQFMNRGKQTPEKQAAFALKVAGWDRDKAVSGLQKNFEYHADRAIPGKYAEGPELEEGNRLLAKETQEAIDHVRSGKILGPRTYKVKLHVKPHELIDWDEPLSEQHPNIQAVLGSSHETAGSKLSRVNRNPNYRGDILGKDTATLQELYDHFLSKGIKGIRYNDAGSRHGPSGDGTKNYVMFHHDPVQVVDKYEYGGTVNDDNPAPVIQNPMSIFPKPQRMFPEDQRPKGGQYISAHNKADVTGHKAEAATIGIGPNGKPFFQASQNAVDQTGTVGKGSATTKTNLFKQKAGWKWQDAPEGHENTETIVSVEHRGKHFYALNAHFPKGVDLARYENAPSEPRLRPTTQGNVTLGPQAGSISVRGKMHPVYHHVIVKADGGAVDDALALTRRFTKDGAGATMALKPKGK